VALVLSEARGVGGDGRWHRWRWAAMAAARGKLECRRVHETHITSTQSTVMWVLSLAWHMGMVKGLSMEPDVDCDGGGDISIDDSGSDGVVAAAVETRVRTSVWGGLKVNLRAV
jgi:hypothetical protein